MHVYITWFKRSGKFYSEGETDYPVQHFHEAVDRFKQDLATGIRPGLVNSLQNDFHALVTVYTTDGPLPFLVTV